MISSIPLVPSLVTRFVFLRYDRCVLSPRSLGTAMYVDLAEIGPLLPFNWITVAFLSSILSRGQGEILLTRLLAISSALFDAISIKREIKATPTRHYHVTPWLLLASSPFPVPFSPPHTRSKRASFSPRISVRFVLRASGI